MSRLYPAAAVLEPNSEVLRVLEAYLEELEDGGQPQPEELLARHPELEEPLRACLASLELLHDAARNLQTNPQEPDVLAGPPLPELRQLGEYRIVREVGRGGMGIVYEAEQLSLQRRVALKVLPFTAALDSKQMQRFKNEAQAAAHLHHQNIVPVYAVGSQRGVHYYAMQFIEGRSLASWIEELREASPERDCDGKTVTQLPPERILPAPCEEPTEVRRPHHARAGDQTPRCAARSPEKTPALETLSRTRDTATSAGYYRRVAQWGVQAAEALHHAHSQGIVHRDIKPANLLIDVRGSLWITDFGLARLANETGGLTLSGDLLGTLRYMSPEQALARRGLVDHRTDIYALGATLYELLTLQPVFGGGDRQELLQQIAFEEPFAPRRVRATVPADLETIVLKALSKEPHGRFATGQELADDLRRFLEHKPILAKAPTPWERLSKLARRHRSAVLSALVLLVVALAGLAMSSFFIWQADAQKDKALVQLSAEVQKRKAEADEAQWQRQRAEANFHKACVGVTQLLSLVQEQRWSNVPRINEVRQNLLAEGLKFFQGFLNEQSMDPAVRLESGRAYLVLASIYGLEARKQEAQDACGQAIAILDQLSAEFPCEVLYRWEVAFSHHVLGLILQETDCAAEAQAEFRRATQGYREARRQGWEVRGINNYAWFLATCPQLEFRDPAEAVVLAQEAAAYAPRCGNVWNTLGAAYYRTGNWQAAIDALKKSMEYRAGGDSSDWFFLAMAHYQLGDRAQADSWFNKALQDIQRNVVIFESLANYRAEAAALLGRETPKRGAKG